MAAGDRAIMRATRSVRGQQLADGSMPQFVGQRQDRTRLFNTQLDEVAYPILMADQPGFH